MVAVVGVPDQLGCFPLVIWGLGSRCDHHGPEHARAPPCPPFRHLVDRLARIALDGGDVVDGQNGEINFEAGFGSVRVVEIHRWQLPHFSGADRFSDGFRQALLFGVFHFRHGHASILISTTR